MNLYLYTLLCLEQHYTIGRFLNFLCSPKKYRLRMFFRSETLQIAFLYNVETDNLIFYFIIFWQRFYISHPSFFTVPTIWYQLSALGLRQFFNKFCDKRQFDNVLRLIFVKFKNVRSLAFKWSFDMRKFKTVSYCRVGCSVRPALPVITYQCLIFNFLLVAKSVCHPVILSHVIIETKITKTVKQCHFKTCVNFKTFSVLFILQLKRFI